jgi:hypothetical protein
MAEDWATIAPPTFAEETEVINHGAASTLLTNSTAAAPANFPLLTNPFSSAPRASTSIAKFSWCVSGYPYPAHFRPVSSG